MGNNSIYQLDLIIDHHINSIRQIGMEFIKEPTNIDLVVGPSILTKNTKKTIAQAIAYYKRTGEKVMGTEAFVAITNS